MEFEEYNDMEDMDDIEDIDDMEMSEDDYLDISEESFSDGEPAETLDSEEVEEVEDLDGFEELQETPSKNIEVQNPTTPQEPVSKITNELRGLISGYPQYLIFENREDTLNVIKDIVLIYKLMNYCEIKSVKPEVKEEIRKMREDLENRGILEMISNYNSFISKKMNFGSSRARKNLDAFVNLNMNFLIELIQFWLYVLPFKAKKDMHMDTAHGLPAFTAADFERKEIEKGEKIVNTDGPFRIDDEGEVIPA